MTETSNGTPRRLVAIGKYQAGEPVYTTCDPGLIEGVARGGKDSVPAHLRMVVDVLRERLRTYMPGSPPLDVAPVTLLVTDPEAALADQRTRDLIEWIARKGRVCRVYVQIHADKLSPQTQFRNASLLDWLREGGERP